MMDAHEKGLNQVELVAGQYGLEVFKQLTNDFPEFSNYIIESAYGNLFQRNLLTLKEKSMVTVTSLLSQGAFEQLDFHLRAALHVGMTLDEIKSLLLHCIPYVGVPKCMSAFHVLQNIVKEN